MKNIIKLLYLPLALSIAVACQEKDNLDPAGGWSLTEPVLGTLANLALDETSPNDTVRFEWQESVASNRFLVQYRVVLIPANSDDYQNPIMTVAAANNGKALYATTTAQQIDYALWVACYPAGEAADLKWAVVAKAIEVESVSAKAVTITRFDTEFIPSTLFLTGSATEVGTEADDAVAMRARKDSDGNTTGIFDIYTTLNLGGSFQFRNQANDQSKVFGSEEGAIVGCAEAIAAPDTAQYRVVVDLNNNTYNLLKIEKWSLVGDAIEGGWGGDVPLAYKGNGVWEAKVNFVSEANFIFRANGDWGYIIKRVTGTATPDNNGGKVIMESEKDAAGVGVEDVPATASGMHTVTLNLSADGYTYSLVADPVAPPTGAVFGESANPEADKVSGNFAFGEFDTPATLFLVSDGAMIAELTKDGDVFRSEIYVALQESKKYILNTAADGSGTSYNDLGDGLISVARDQAYQINVDFAAGKVLWAHYNIKLFHWDEVGGGWDARQELPLTYTHPYQYALQDASLTAGFHSKFNSPWEVQFGTSGTDLSGTMTNGGPNFAGITQTGVYNANITVSDDYTTATYEFIKQ